MRPADRQRSPRSKNQNRSFQALLVFALAACSPASQAQSGSAWVQSLTASVAGTVTGSLGAVIPDRYIIRFKGHDGLSRLSELGLNAADITQVYSAVFPGVAMRLPDHLAQGLAAHPLVAAIEPDRIMSLNETQVNPPWGLDRIDQRSKAYDSRYNYRAAGAGVHVYVLDSGLRRTHREFTGRVGNGFDAVGSTGGVGSPITIGGRRSGGLLGLGRSSQQDMQPTDPMDPSSTPDDCNGHGTHVAGTAAGTTFGVAKKAIVHGVRVVNCQGVGTSSTTVAGLEWVIRNHVAPAVVNMSLGGGTSDVVDQAVRSAHQAGITVVVAAGNETMDACTVSPAREPLAVSVAATGRDDRRGSYSNFGRCVDLFAPGSDVVSAGNRSDSDQTVKTGTSMSSPHVAGAVAKLLSEGVKPADIMKVLLERATRSVVVDERGSPNVMLFTD